MNDIFVLPIPDRFHYSLAFRTVYSCMFALYNIYLPYKIEDTGSIWIPLGFVVLNLFDVYMAMVPAVNIPPLGPRNLYE